jgi:predicted ATP-grasp superfamily ATP-dependent carboligase
VSRVLVLDGHTNQALACVRSLGRAGHTVLVASSWRWPLAAWSRYCAGRVRLAGPPLEAHSNLRRWVQSRGVEIILPLTERSCLLCNMERVEWESTGAVVGCGPPEMLAQAFDKQQTLRLALASNVRIPTTQFPASIAECHRAGEAVGFPSVIKARFSNAWNVDRRAFWQDLGCAYARNTGELEQAVRVRVQGESWPIVQSYVPGQGRAVSVLCDRGRLVAAFAHERLRDVRPTGSGSSLRRSIALDNRLREPTMRLLTAFAWHGPAMVEFRDDGVGEPFLMEINGRFWGSLQLGVDAGVDFPRLWVSILAGEHPAPVERYREGVTLRWLWGDVKRVLNIAAGPPSGYSGGFPTLRQGVAEVFGGQPTATKLEAWRPDDRWPAVGELAQGVRELLAQVVRGDS